MATQDESPAILQAEITRLRADLATMEMERSDLEILLETTTEHSTEIEAELQDTNETMRLYLEQVARVTSAAGMVEAGTYIIDSLDEVAARDDGLGQLARVFQRMVTQVYAREQQLKRQVEELRIEIDQSKQAKQVAEITESDYFQELQTKIQTLRKRRS